jgi:hypothetical protein
MDLPILKYLDVLIGFTLVMILAGTVVATITQVCAVLARSRGRYLANSLRLLISQTDPVNLPKDIAAKIVEHVLRHPLIGKPNLFCLTIARLRLLFGREVIPKPSDRVRGTVIKREELVCLLLEIAAGDECPVADHLRTAFDIDAAEARRLRQEIEKQILSLESAEPNQAACVRETQGMKNVLENSNAYALVSRLTGWFDHAMNRVTVAYSSEAKMATAVVALGVAVWFQLDSVAILERLAVDDKMRAAMVSEAELQQKKIDELAKQPSPAAAAPASPADDLELLKQQKAAIDASIADMSQPGLGILTPFYEAATLPGKTVSSNRCDLAVGTKLYPVNRTANETLADLASHINALGAGVAARVRGSILTIQSLRPNVNILELRTDADGVNILGPATVFHAQSAEARSQPLDVIEPGKYRLNLGKRTFDVAVQDGQTPANLADAINNLNSDLSARTEDGPNCRDCVLVVAAKTPDFAHIKLLADSGKIDLIKKVAVESGRVIATTNRLAFPPPRDYQILIGDRKYDAITLAEKESFAELARKLNASKAGSDLRAQIANASAADCRDCYILTLSGDVPDLRQIGLRKRVGGTNILGPAESYYSMANLVNSWKGIFLSWVLLSLGTPFWYDMLKNLLRLRPTLAKQEEQERAQRQNRQ